MKLNSVAIMLVAVLTIGGCGQKGDLYRSADVSPRIHVAF